MPTHIIFHVETNDALDQIVGNIVNLAINLKKNRDVSMPGITARNNQYSKKATDVNWELKER